MRLFGTLLAAVVAVGCAAETAPMGAEDELSKEEARARGGKTDFGLDFCEIFGWYGDGVCDDFCPFFDPDCATTDPTCGGLAGLTCDPGFWCDYPDGAACGAADQTGTCEEIPEPGTVVCPAVYAPVCGCDGNTYSNECAANAAGTDVASAGECSSSACMDDLDCPQPFCLPGGPCPRFICLANECVAEGSVECTDDLDCPQPQCLPGGPCPTIICQDNMCVREEESACQDDLDCPQVQCLPGGPCPWFSCVAGECVEDGPQACGSRGLPSCPAGQFCQYPESADCGRADVPGTCTALPNPGEAFCPAVYMPVCGCDGRTYGNSCEAQRAGASVDYQGPCATDCRATPCGAGEECQYCFGTFQCVPEGAMC